MEKFIPYEKLSKKEKRKLDQARRQSWRGLNPVTRKPANSKAYNRRKSQDWKRERPACDFFICRDAPAGSGASHCSGIREEPSPGDRQ